MKKIKVSADTILAILKGLMNDEEINTKITDTTAPQEWQNKSVQEVLNVEYYTFKHRPIDTEQLVAELIKQGKDYDTLHALTRAFCILSLTSTERVFSKDNDTVTISAELEYWIQTSKVKILENLVEDLAIETSGIRIPVQIGTEQRRAIIAFSNLNVTDIQEVTEFGEMSVCSLNIDFIFYPNVVGRDDYTLEFWDTDIWVKLPFSSLAFSSTMNQQAVPYANNVRNVGSINLSKVKSFSLTFDGYINNGFIDFITKMSMQSDNADGVNNYDNNKQIRMKITRADTVFEYDCIVKDHSIIVKEDTGNEAHSLTLTTRGL